jgi:hypothetical protein
MIDNSWNVHLQVYVYKHHPNQIYPLKYSFILPSSITKHPSKNDFISLLIFSLLSGKSNKVCYNSC